MKNESLPSKAGERVERFVGKLATEPPGSSDAMDVVRQGRFDVITNDGNVPLVDELQVEILRDPKDTPERGNPDDMSELSTITLSGAGTTVAEIHYDGEEVVTYAGDNVESEGVMAEVFADNTVDTLEQLLSEGKIQPNSYGKRSEA